MPSSSQGYRGELVNICTKCKQDKPADSPTPSNSWCKSCERDRYHTPETKLRKVYSDQKKAGVTYSIGEWIAWGMSNQRYLDMFHEWERSGFKRGNTPTFYRKDASELFSLDNLNMDYWKVAKYQLAMEV